jgi:hypothetical protein
MVEKLITRRQAAQYITQNYFPCSAATLAKRAVYGSGPPYQKAGQIAVYSPPRLDEWAASRIGAEIKSTAELPPEQRPHPMRPRGRPRKNKPKVAAE